jgi:hypothetical protein
VIRELGSERRETVSSPSCLPISVLNFSKFEKGNSVRLIGSTPVEINLAVCWKHSLNS